MKNVVSLTTQMAVIEFLKKYFPQSRINEKRWTLEQITDEVNNHESKEEWQKTQSERKNLTTSNMDTILEAAGLKTFRAFRQVTPKCNKRPVSSTRFTAEEISSLVSIEVNKQLTAMVRNLGITNDTIRAFLSKSAEAPEPKG